MEVQETLLRAFGPPFQNLVRFRTKKKRGGSLRLLFPAEGRSRSMADLSSKALGGQPLRTSGRHFIDGYGRIVQMRGFNVSGACKL